MQNNTPNTVTISLDKYEAMQNEIKTLREQVKEKEITIIKEPDWYQKTGLFTAIAIGVALWFHLIALT